MSGDEKNADNDKLVVDFESQARMMVGNWVAIRDALGIEKDSKIDEQLSCIYYSGYIDCARDLSDTTSRFVECDDMDLNKILGKKE